MTRADGALRVLRELPEDLLAGEPAAFCSHCGLAPQGDAAAAARVCSSCGMGLVLQARGEVVPTPADAFLVVDSVLGVGALSAAAERFLAVEEADVVHRPVTELITAADSESVGTDLGSAVVWAAGGDRSARELHVRPVNTFGVRYLARIGPCGPPSAAVVVLADA